MFYLLICSKISRLLIITDLERKISIQFNSGVSIIWIVEFKAKYGFTSAVINTQMWIINEENKPQEGNDYKVYFCDEMRSEWWLFRSLLLELKVFAFQNISLA